MVFQNSTTSTKLTYRAEATSVRLPGGAGRALRRQALLTTSAVAVALVIFGGAITKAAVREPGFTAPGGDARRMVPPAIWKLPCWLCMGRGRLRCVRIDTRVVVAFSGARFRLLAAAVAIRHKAGYGI